MTLWADAGGRRTALHLVNHDVDVERDAFRPARNASVTLRLPARFEFNRPRLLAPGAPAAELLFEHPERPRPMGEIAERHFTALGTGVVGFTGVVAELTKAGYDGWLVVEQDASPAPRETSAISLQHLRYVTVG